MHVDWESTSKCIEMDNKKQAKAMQKLQKSVPFQKSLVFWDFVKENNRKDL